MVDSHLEGEGAQRVEVEVRLSNESSGTSETRYRVHSSHKSQRSLSRSKTSSHQRRSKRLENRSKSKEKAKEGRTKSRERNSGYEGTISDSDGEEDSKDTCEDLSSKDPEDYLGIFSAVVEQEEWPMPIWFKMFRQTLRGAAQNWFDDLDPKSVDCYEKLSQKFLEEFLQQKRYAKDPTEINGIKRRLNEGLQAFTDRFKSESSHIKGVPPVLHISAFMHGHEHLELAKKLNDKIPKTADEMHGYTISSLIDTAYWSSE
ncbi:reverse transcriptase domain-containing protein [Tanacetum coccineum]